MAKRAQPSRDAIRLRTEVKTKGMSEIVSAECVRSESSDDDDDDDNDEDGGGGGDGSGGGGGDDDDVSMLINAPHNLLITRRVVVWVLNYTQAGAGNGVPLAPFSCCSGCKVEGKVSRFV